MSLTGPVWLDNVSCEGTEAALVVCPSSGLDQRNCSLGKVAGVTCTSTSHVCMHIPLLVDSTQAWLYDRFLVYLLLQLAFSHLQTFLSHYWMPLSDWLVAVVLAKDELKSCTTKNGEQYVMTFGTWTMLRWCAVNWALESLYQVRELAAMSWDWILYHSGILLRLSLVVTLEPERVAHLFGWTMLLAMEMKCMWLTAYHLLLESTTAITPKMQE